MCIYSFTNKVVTLPYANERLLLFIFSLYSTDIQAIRVCILPLKTTKYTHRTIYYVRSNYRFYSSLDVLQVGNKDLHAKDLTCYNQLLHLLFGQSTACDSLRDLCLEAHKDLRELLTQPNNLFTSSQNIKELNLSFYPNSGHRGFILRINKMELLTNYTTSTNRRLETVFVEFFKVNFLDSSPMWKK